MGPAPHHDYLLEHPSDGSLFINYLGVAFEHFAEGWIIDHQLLAAHCKMVCRGLQEYESDTRIRPKYTWLATYHNYVCCSFADQLLAEGHERVDPEEIDLKAAAQSVLEHVVPFDALPTEQSPRLLDEQRLQQRLLVNDSYSGRSCCLTGICYRNFLSF